MLFSLSLAGCSLGASYQTELEYIEQIIEEQPDSALSHLNRIGRVIDKKGRERALYNLLLTESLYKLYKPINDTLVNYSIEFYEQRHDNRHLAMSYYYKGVVIDNMGKTEDAVLYLKKAENLAQKENDELLKNKIYENLHYINLQSHNYKLAMYYARFFLSSSFVMKDTALICKAYDDIANTYSYRQMPDSAYFYRNRLRLLISDKMQTNPYLLTNYANDLLKRGNMSDAKTLLEKAIEHRPMANQYVMLGKIAHAEGDTLAARTYWEKALSYNDPPFSINAYRQLGYMAYEQHFYKRATWMLAMADSLNEAYHEQIHTAKLSEIQQKYDHAIELKNNAETLNFWLVILVCVIILLAGGAIYHLLKVRKFRNAISENILTINEAERKIALLQSSGKNFEHEIKQLNSQMERLKERTAEQLGRGKLIYETAMRREWLKNFSTTDEQSFIDYYAFAYTDLFNKLTSPYSSLTRRQATYLIFHDMGLTDDDIQIVLNISRTTIRSYRHRFKSDVKHGQSGVGTAAHQRFGQQ